jgi:hypothetical protein
MLPEIIWKTTDQIDSDVQSFLDTHHPSKTIPIPIESIVDNKLGIDIIAVQGLKDVFSAIELDIDAFISSDFSSITVDKYVYEKCSTRYRFTLAHEIGHYVLHGYLYNHFEFDSIASWSSVIDTLPERLVDIVEWQANEFAGLLLVSRTGLKEAFEEAVDETKSILGSKYKNNLDIVLDLAVIPLAKRYVVSEEAMRIRLQRDSLIPKKWNHRLLTLC